MKVHVYNQHVQEAGQQAELLQTNFSNNSERTVSTNYLFWKKNVSAALPSTFLKQSLRNFCLME